MRIASLLPAATEIVDALGLTDNLVAVTHACTYPEAARSKPRITRSRLPEAIPLQSAGPALGWQVENQPIVAIDREALEAAQPNIILTQPLDDSATIPYDDVMEAIASLPSPKPRVVDVHSTSMADIIQSIRDIGIATGREMRADNVCDALWHRTERIRAGVSQHARTRPRAIVIEWINPLFSGGYWQHELVRTAGGEDYSRDSRGTGCISWHQVREFKPEVIVVAPYNCPMEQGLKDMSALEALPGYWSLPAVRNGRVYLVDGRHYFNGYGPRIVHTLELLAYMLHPKLFPDLVPSASQAICWY